MAVRCDGLVGDRTGHRPGVHRVWHCRVWHRAGGRADPDPVYAAVENRAIAGAAGFCRGLGNLLPSRRDVDKPELLRLLPCMALGCTLGVIFLLNLKSDLLLLLMGLFISAYAVYSLWVKARPTQLAAGWAVPMGIVGGMFGALFGSGGFLYAIYLNSRLPKDAARATQSALISCSTVVRLSLFAVAGVYAELPLLVLAVCLLPAMALGLWIGRRLTMKLSREAFVRMVTWLVLASGIALIGRYLST